MKTTTTEGAEADEDASARARVAADLALLLALRWIEGATDRAGPAGAAAQGERTPPPPDIQC